MDCVDFGVWVLKNGGDYDEAKAIKAEKGERFPFDLVVFILGA